MIVGPDGIEVEDFQTHRERINALIRSPEMFGADAAVSDRDFLGKIAVILANLLLSIDQSAQNIVSKISYENAEGQTLAFLASLKGIKSKPGKRSRASIVFSHETTGTDVIEGTELKDSLGRKWITESTGIILGGTCTVLAYCESVGPIVLQPDSITGFYVSAPVEGLEILSSTHASTGSLPESEQSIKRRMRFADITSYSSNNGGIENFLLSKRGIQDAYVYSNDTNEDDDNGVPAKCIAVAVDVTTATDEEIAKAIDSLRPGTADTFGTESYTVYDSSGVGHIIRWSLVEVSQFYVMAELTVADGETIDDEMKYKIRSEIVQQSEIVKKIGKKVTRAQYFKIVSDIVGSKCDDINIQLSSDGSTWGQGPINVDGIFKRLETSIDNVSVVID